MLKRRLRAVQQFGQFFHIVLTATRLPAASGACLCHGSYQYPALGGPGVVGSFGGVCRDLHRHVLHQNVAFCLTAARAWHKS